MGKRKAVTDSEKILIVIIALYSMLVALSNSAFISFETVFDILRSSSTTMIVAMGLLVVMLSGGIDVSFMSIALFGGYVTSFMMIQNHINNLAFALAISMMMGTCLGACNALLIHWLGLPAFIITLGTQNIFHGVMTTFISNKTYGAGVIPTVLTEFGSSTLFTVDSKLGIMGLTTSIIPVAVVALITYLLINKTLIGRGVVALGNSEDAAVRSGFRPLRIRLFAYSYLGALSGLMGIVYFSQVNAVYPNKLVGDELMVIAGAVIGGVKATGGVGKVLGVILGVVVIYLLNSTLIFLGLSSSWNNLFIGSLLVFSVAATSWQNRIQNRKNLIFTE